MRLAFALLLVTPLFAGADDKPAWKWDKPFYIECELETKSAYTASVDAKEDTTIAEARAVFKVTPQPNEDGTVRLVHEITAFRFSKETDKEKVENKVFAKLAGGKFAITRAENGSLSKMEGIPALMERVLGKMPETDVAKKQTKALGAIFATMLDSLIAEAYFPIPTADGEKGAVKSDHTMKLAGILDLKFRRTYTATGTVAEGGKTYSTLKMAAEGTLSAPKEDSDLLPFKFLEIKATKPIKHTAEVAFDPVAGRGHRVTVKTSGECSAVAEINGEKVTLNGSDARTLTVRFFDKNPDEKKPK